MVMRLLLISGVYTAISFGIQILLFLFSSRPHLLEGPMFLSHPIFAVGFLLMLSIAILWITISLKSLRSCLMQKSGAGSVVKQHISLILLVSVTLIAAISGCLFYVRIISYGSPGSSGPNLFAVSHFFGSLFCEPSWIAFALHARRN